MPFSLPDLALLDFRSPYIQIEFLGKKQCSLRTLRKSAGVYIIKENGVIVYIGYSATRLHSTLYRHFQKWTDIRNIWRIPKMTPPYPRVSYKDYLEIKNYTIAAIECSNGMYAHELEIALIREHQPRDNKEKYELFKDYVVTAYKQVNLIEQTEAPF